MFEELEDSYASDSLEDYDYEEIYERFTHMEYLTEVKPYLFAMRYLGKGTKAEPEQVLEEIKELLSLADVQIRGIYFDMKLLSGRGTVQDRNELEKCISEGYSDKYLRKESQIHKIDEVDTEEDEKEIVQEIIADGSEKVVFKSMSFEGCGYNGLYFTAGDIDYLHARVLIEPVQSIRHLNVRSQIYADDNPFSEVFSDEITLNPGDSSFKTTGWGNEYFSCYYGCVYKWILELDGKEIYSQEFQFYDGKIDKSGIYIKEIKLFASKASGALERDIKNYKTSFDSNTLEYVYFKLFMDPPGETKNIQIFIRVTCLEDNTLFYNNYVLQRLTSDCTGCWNGIGFSEKGKWKKGLYDYIICVGKGSMYKGTFSVY